MWVEDVTENKKKVEKPRQWRQNEKFFIAIHKGDGWNEKLPRNVGESII